MSYRDVKTLTARKQNQLKFVKRTSKLATAFQCLIVSADSQRGEMLERAATEGGWKTSVCADTPSALTYINRTIVQMAVVDLEKQLPDVFRPVVEQLTSCSGLLLIVCGNEGVMDEELWVRQLGAWLYLPGVVDGNNLTLLCSEARHIAERLSRSSRAEQPAAKLAERRSYP